MKGLSLFLLVAVLAGMVNAQFLLGVLADRLYHQNQGHGGHHHHHHGHGISQPIKNNLKKKVEIPIF